MSSRLLSMKFMKRKAAQSSDPEASSSKDEELNGSKAEEMAESEKWSIQSDVVKAMLEKEAL